MAYLLVLAAPFAVLWAMFAAFAQPVTGELDRLAITQHRAAPQAPTSKAPGPQTASEPPRAIIVTRGVYSATQDFNDLIKEPGFWAKRRTGGGGSSWSSPAPGYGNRSNLGAPVPQEPSNPFTTFFRLFEPEPSAQPEIRSNYRTVCVRLCDGFYWPVSSGTTQAHFQRDQKVCEASCAGGARLFTYLNSDEPDSMTDLRGNAYINLPTAFAFRTKYDPMCKCKPHPWEQEAQDQHKIYALDTIRRRGGPMSRPANQEIAALETRVQEARREREEAAIDYTAQLLNERPGTRRQVLQPAPERRGEVRPTPPTKSEVTAPQAETTAAPPAAAPAMPAAPARPIITPGLSPRAQAQPKAGEITAANSLNPTSDVQIMRLGVPPNGVTQPPPAVQPGAQTNPSARKPDGRSPAQRREQQRQRPDGATANPATTSHFRFPINDSR